MISLGVVPPVAAAAVLFPLIWPWAPAIQHVTILAFLATLLAEACLLGTQKLPFTCSYLPGTSRFHLTFWLSVWGLQFVVVEGTAFELRTLTDAVAYLTLVGIFAIGVVCARWWTFAEARAEEAQVQFEESVPPVILRLGLGRDGI